MKRVAAYIALRLKLRLGNDSEADKKGQYSTLFIGVITCVVLLLLLKYLFGILFDQLPATIDKDEFSTLVLTLLMTVLAISVVTMSVRYLLRPADIPITAKFPLSPFQIFVAEVTTIYMTISVLSIMLYLPVMAVFGWAAHYMSWAFLGRVVLTALIAPLVPFSAGLILAVPTMLILTLLENHNLIRLIIFILTLAGLFVLYDYFLNLIADFYIHKRLEEQTISEWSVFIVSINNRFNPAVWLKEVLFGINTQKGVLLSLAAFAVMLVPAMLAAKPAYDKIRLKTLEGGFSAFAKKSTVGGGNAFFAIFAKEFKDIMRTRTYAYFYLGVAITMPVMVFLCDRLVEKVGKAQIGGNINFGVSILVITAFLGMINSFSAGLISREGNTFYITRMTPLKFSKQLLSKGLLIFLVSMGALALSCVIITTLKFVTMSQVGVILAAGALLSAGLIANGFNINVRHPYLRSKINGEINETNLTKLLSIGMMLAVAVGALSLILPYSIDFKYIYIIVICLAFVYALVNVLVFALTVDKRYNEIE